MEPIVGNARIPVSKEELWKALNDSETLKRCVPGCQSLTKISDQELEGRITLKVGPMIAEFDGSITLEELDPPHRCVIVGKAQAGPKGFVEGRAVVQIDEVEPGVSSLGYSVQAQVGGKLAQIGSRLVHSSARKLADEFFRKLNKILSESKVSSSPSFVQQLAEAANWEYPEYLDRQLISVIVCGVLLSWLCFVLFSPGFAPERQPEVPDPRTPEQTFEQRLLDLESRLRRLESPKS